MNFCFADEMLLLTAVNTHHTTVVETKWQNDDAIHQINQYPVDCVVDFVHTNLLNSDKAGGQHYPEWKLQNCSGQLVNYISTGIQWTLELN